MFNVRFRIPLGPVELSRDMAMHSTACKCLSAVQEVVATLLDQGSCISSKCPFAGRRRQCSLLSVPVMECVFLSEVVGPIGSSSCSARPLSRTVPCMIFVVILKCLPARLMCLALSLVVHCSSMLVGCDRLSHRSCETTFRCQIVAVYTLYIKGGRGGMIKVFGQES